MINQPPVIERIYLVVDQEGYEQLAQELDRVARVAERVHAEAVARGASEQAELILTRARTLPGKV